MNSATTCSETDRRIQQITLSLQRLSACVLPDMKQAAEDMLSGDSPFAAASHEALMLHAHQIVGAALKDLGSIAKSQRLADDANKIAKAKESLSLDIELEILQFCARIELDKLQLVSKAMRALIEAVSDRLALHKVYLVSVRKDASRCAVWYHIQRSSIDAVVCDVIPPEQDSDRMEQVPRQANPFRRMRNAFVGALRFEDEGNMPSRFTALLSEFLRTRKGAMKVGRVRLTTKCSEQWFTDLFAFATEEAHADCLALDACRLRMDRLFSAVTLRPRVKRITIKVQSRSLGDAQISALARLAMNSGDIRRIDIVLLDFAQYVEKWIEAITSEESSTQTVDNVLFHCRYEASIPVGIGEPTARLPKRKWSSVNYGGRTCEMEDLDEKAVVVFENANIPKKITAIFARYERQLTGSDSCTNATCNFVFNPSDTLDIGDFSEMHIKTTGVCSFAM